MDLRERVVAAVDAGLTQPQAAIRFGVSLRTVERYLARRRATGSLAATEQRHGPEPRQRRALQAWLAARLGAAPGASRNAARRTGAWLAAPPGGPGGCRPGRARRGVGRRGGRAGVAGGDVA